MEKKLSRKFGQYSGFQPMTRREIIGLWSKQSDEFKDRYCCPNCRDILEEDEGGELICTNSLCHYGQLCLKSSGEGG